MPSLTESVSLDVRDGVALVVVDNPPVNALSFHVRQGILDGMRAAAADDAVSAIVLICSGRTFIAGADITEFGKPPKPPELFDAQDAMEDCPKPVVAAIHGTALGGGLEVAMCAHYRVAGGNGPIRTARGEARPPSWRWWDPAAAPRYRHSKGTRDVCAR